MNVLNIRANLELDPWTDIKPGDVANWGQDAVIERAGLLPNGTAEGRATVAILVRLADGQVVLAETTLRLFLTAAAAFGASPIAEMEEM